MMNVNKDGRSYEQQLEQHLLPILHDYLTIHPLGRLVWLIQPSSLDRHVSLPMDVKFVPEINADKIYQYNQITRRILKYIYLELIILKNLSIKDFKIEYRIFK